MSRKRAVAPPRAAAGRRRRHLRLPHAWPPPALVLTGIVTTNDVIVSPQIAGQIGQLLVNEGDAVKKDQLRRGDRARRAEGRHRLLRAERRRACRRRFASRRRRCGSRSGRPSTRSARPNRRWRRSKRRPRRRPPTSSRRGSPTRAPRTCRAQNVVSAQELDPARTAQTAAQAQARRAEEAGRGAARDRRAGALQRRADRRCGAARCRPAST